MDKIFNVGDYVYLSRSPEQILWRPGMFKPEVIKKPMKIKVINVTESKERGFIYQTRRHSFDNSSIGIVVFNSYEQAEENIKERLKL